MDKKAILEKVKELGVLAVIRGTFTRANHKNGGSFDRRWSNRDRDHL